MPHVPVYLVLVYCKDAGSARDATYIALTRRNEDTVDCGVDRIHSDLSCTTVQSTTVARRDQSQAPAADTRFPRALERMDTGEMNFS